MVAPLAAAPLAGSASPAPAPRFATVAIPQADDLDTVRRVLEVVAGGCATRASVQEVTGFTERHMQYRVHAALLLGLLAEDDEDALQLTLVGKAILDAPARSDEERSLWRQAFVTVPALAEVASDLFGPTAPKRQHLASRLSAATLMARSTAVRRASTLLAWRRRMLPRQLELFDEL